MSSGEKRDGPWVKTFFFFFFCSSPKFGRKMRLNLSGTTSDSDLCSSKFSEIFGPPLFKILRTLLYRIYSRIGRNFFLLFFNKKHGCDLSARHTLKVFGYCKYRIFRLISRYRHELRLRLCSHIPMRDSFMRAHAHATAQRALDFPALLRKNGFAILMFDFEVICF